MEVVRGVGHPPGHGGEAPMRGDVSGFGGPSPVFSPAGFHLAVLVLLEYGEGRCGEDVPAALLLDVVTYSRLAERRRFSVMGCW